jgi:hypothetical protein
MTEAKLIRQATGREVGYAALFLISNEPSYANARTLVREKLNGSQHCLLKAELPTPHHLQFSGKPQHEHCDQTVRALQAWTPNPPQPLRNGAADP